MKVALAIAGSDSGGGAGIQADLAAFRALGVWGTTAITCLTAQNPDEVTRIEPTPPAMVAEQIRVVARRFPVAAIKIGMTHSAPIIKAIARAIRQHLSGVPVVLDPVMRATSGAALLLPGAEAALAAELLPLAAVTTPNLAEACALAGMEAIASVSEMEEAARRIHARAGGVAVLVKGGHLDDRATDVLFDGTTMTRLHGRRIETPFTHGTGCAFASAICAELAKGRGLLPAARTAKRFLTAILAGAVSLGDPALGGLGFVPEGGSWTKPCRAGRSPGARPTRARRDPRTRGE